MEQQSLVTRLPSHIHEAELQTVRARRRAAALDADSPTALPGGEPSPVRGLIGLAISGGGIRSSTFSLGVLQALARHRVFERFDFMSTVSGGGYTGSMLSSLLRDGGDADAGFPLTKPEGEGEPAALQHLRNGSNYLNPGGPFDNLRLPAIVIRGLLLNLLLFLPHLMLATILTELLHESRILAWWPPDLDPFVQWLRSGLNALWLVVLLVPLYVVASGMRDRRWPVRNRLENAFTWLLVGVGLLLLAVPASIAIDAAMSYPLYGEEGLIHFVETHIRAGTVVVALVAVFGSVALVRASAHMSSIASKLLLGLATIAGPAIVFGLYLLLLVAQVDSPFIAGAFPELSESDPQGAPRSGTLRMEEELRHALGMRGLAYERTSMSVVRCPDGAFHLPHPDTTRVSEVSVTVCDLTDDEIEDADSVIRLLPLGADERAGPQGRTWEVVGAGLRWGPIPSDEALFGDWTFLGLTIVLYLFNWLFVDVNKSSLHGFYRDRLSKLYLFRRGAGGTITPNDEQKLSDLNRPGSVAPYHIVNTTVNLQGVATLGVRGRGSDFFFFSKHYCGGPNTGYVETEEMERWDKNVNLGTAMAISAAAAAPNMGRTTVRSMVFMLTLLNFRLNYWVPNPDKRKWRRRLLPLGVPRARSWQLWKEATSDLDADGPLVNLSDGGHLENLAIYELLRRECRTIVAIDGEADPHLTFEGLVTLIRIARIDLGIEIDIDLSRIHWGADGCTQDHFAIGTITYGEGRTGTLVYVKSSVTGDEGPVLKKYREDHPLFPHETTADQFFDELQFEAYRSLGEHVGQGVALGAGREGVYGFEGARPR